MMKNSSKNVCCLPTRKSIKGIKVSRNHLNIHPPLPTTPAATTITDPSHEFYKDVSFSQVLQLMIKLTMITDKFYKDGSFQ